MPDSRVPSLSGRDVVVVAVLATLSFIVENTLGLLLVPFLAGIPLVGGTLSAIPDAAIVFLGAYLVPRRGSILLFAVLLLSLSTFTPSFGPPGIYKVVIGFALGLIFELILLISRKPMTYVLATGVAFSASIPVTWLAWVLFELPGVEQLAESIPFLSGIYFVLGVCGAALGYWIYSSRLDGLRIVKRIRDVA